MHLHADEQHSRLFLSSKALLATEAYIFARYHMYRTVYFHKTTRAAEVMLRWLFQRYGAFVAGKPLSEAASVVPDAPREVVQAFCTKLELHDYLELDDHSVSQFCKACEDSKDQVLSWLGGGLLHRQYLKAIDATGCSPDSVRNFTVEAANLLKKQGYDENFSFGTDSPGDTPYQMYDPDSDDPNTQIYIENRDGKPVEISSLSDPVAQLRKKYVLARFYFPTDVRDDIQRIASGTLRN